MWEFCVLSLFSFAVHSFLSTFAIISLRKRELVALLCLLAAVRLSVFCVSSSWCRWLVGLQFVIVAFPGHTHLFFHVVF